MLNHRDVLSFKSIFSATALSKHLRRTSKILFISLVASLLVAPIAHAAGYDCAKASTKVEKMICSDHELSKLDEELDAAYQKAIKEDKNVDSIKKTQREWLKGRNACSDISCVKKAYEEWIGALEELSWVSKLFVAQKKYPPYPDVWGYELLVYGADPYCSPILKMPDGDYMSVYPRVRKGDDVNGKYTYAWMLFFSELKEDFDMYEFDIFLRIYQNYKIDITYDPLKRVDFGDGSSVEYKHSSLNCSNNFDRFLQKKDKKGNVVAKKMLLYLYDEPIEKDIYDICERNWDEKEEHYLTRVENIGISNLILLEDGTFLIFAYAHKSIVVLRLDKDLNTKSNMIGENIFLIDYKTREKLRNSKPAIVSDREISEALSDYLLKIKGDK